MSFVRADRRPDLEIVFWRTSSGFEVDFLLTDRLLAVEVKGAGRVLEWHHIRHHPIYTA